MPIDNNMKKLPEIQKHIVELTDILRHEIRSFNTIIELMILEEKGLIESDNQLIVKVLEKQEDVFSSIACLEKSRLNLIEKIAENINSIPEKLTITKIAAYAEESYRSDLLETAHVLSKINKDINNRRNSNSMLIRQGMAMIESNIRFLLKTMGKDDPSQGLYSSKANLKGLNGSVRIDGRI
jgi:hypothetical protein